MDNENKTYRQKIVEMMANKNINVKTIEGVEKSVVAYMKNGSAMYRCYFEDISAIYLQVYSIIELPIQKDREIELLKLISKHNHRAVGSKFNIIKNSKENFTDFLVTVQSPIFKELFSEAYLYNVVADVDYNVGQIFKDLLLLLTKEEPENK